MRGIDELLYCPRKYVFQENKLSRNGSSTFDTDRHTKEFC